MRKTTYEGRWVQRALLLASLVVWGISSPAIVSGQSDVDGDREVADASDAPATITIGAEPDYPPYSYVDDTGHAAGFSVELFRAAATAMNLDVRIQIAPWNTIKGQLADGELDALPLVGRTPEREELFDFTVPYLSLHGGIVVHEDTQEIAGFPDLSGRRVAVMKGDNAEEFLRRSDQQFEIVTTASFHDALQLLAEGRSDAVVVQRLVALRLLEQGDFPRLRLLDKPIPDFTQDFCFAVTEGDKELLARLNEGLALIIADGTLRRLQTAWFASVELPTRAIRVGGDHNYPPFEFINEAGEPDGFNVELIRAIARELDLNVQFHLGPWSEVLGRLERGEIDLIQGMMYSAERDRRYDFSPAHTVHQNVAVGRSDNTPVPDTVEALRGHVVVVQDGDLMHEFAREHGLTDNLVVVDTQEEALRLVLAGDADYALGSRLTALYLREKYGWNNLVIGGRQLATHEYGFAVNEGNGRLLSYFNEGLAVLEESGEYRAIYDRWLGASVPTSRDPVQVLRTILLVVVPVLLLLAAALLWIRLLRNEVSRRTAELREREALYRLLSENTLDVIWLVSPDLRIRHVNPAITAVTGVSHEEWIGTRVAEHFDRTSYRRLSRAVSGAITTRTDNAEFEVEVDFASRGGVTVPVSITGTVLRGENGALDGFQGVARDISERKQYEMTLEQSAQRQEWLNMIATVYLAGHETGRVIQYVVEDMARHFPEYRVDYCVITNAGTLLVSPSTRAVPDGTGVSEELDLTRAPKLMERIASAGRLALSDVANDPAATPLRKELRAHRTAALLMVLVPTDDQQPCFLRFRSPVPHEWSNHDILSLEEHANLLALILANERSRRMMEEANASLALSLAEKSTLLKEVHHRVKNNLNIIVSLLRLQEDQIDSVESARDAFEQSRNRIFSMALVHESLYQSESLAEIEMDAYIHDLLDQLIDVSLGGQEISYVFHLEPIRVDITRAIPCGIIVNELLTNIRKHAFTDASREPTITIAFRRVGCLQLELSVADNGSGLPVDFAASESTSLGLHLVHLLAEQMNGTVEITSRQGTRAVVRIPENPTAGSQSEPSAGV